MGTWNYIEIAFILHHTFHIPSQSGIVVILNEIAGSQ